MKNLKPHKEAIKQLCVKYNVTKLYVFGSAVRGTITDASDIDLVVAFKEISLMDYADNYFSFKDELEKLFNRQVDLLEEAGLKNPFLRTQIENQKQLLYG